MIFRDIISIIKYAIPNPIDFKKIYYLVKTKNDDIIQNAF